jgi:peptidoglycan hydrolase-like protein with peptidoglycan-binding domain
MRIRQITKKTARGATLALLAVVTAVVASIPAIPVLAQGPITVPSGTSMRIRVETAIRSVNSTVGDPFRARIASPVVVRGEEVIPGDTMLEGRVVGVSQAKAWGQPSGVTILLESLTSPTGESVKVTGDLVDLNGGLMNTVDNLTAGSEIAFRTTRPFSVDESFFGSDSGSDVFNSPGTVTLAQTVLRDLGFYSGPVDGRLSPATRTAIAQFQRENRLQQTGFLDRDTLARLGLIGNSGQEVVGVNVLSASARLVNNQLVVRIVTQTPSANWQVFENHFRQRDQLHVYLRGVRPLRPGAQVLTTGEIDLALNRADFEGINRIVIHGAGRDITLTSNDFDNGSAQLTVEEAAALEAQISRILVDYSRAIGVRYVPFTGQVIMAKGNYRENEVELLFALNALSSSAKLYTQVIRNTTDPQAIEGATDLFVAQANLVDSAVKRTRSPRAASVTRAWQTTFDQFIQLGADQRTAGFRGVNNQ